MADKMMVTSCVIQNVGHNKDHKNGADKLHEPDGGVDVDAKRFMQSTLGTLKTNPTHKRREVMPV